MRWASARDDAEAGDGDRRRRQAGAERAAAELLLEALVAELVASAQRKTAARYAAVVTASTPISSEVGLSQLLNWPPAALPTGTRPEAIPPTAVPRANGVSTDEIEKTVSIALSSRGPVAPARSA